jgi:hypothetical protein
MYSHVSVLLNDAMLKETEINVKNIVFWDVAL